ncbi:GntR family transcriptional regulator [Streptomyces sp. NPDC054796]
MEQTRAEGPIRPGRNALRTRVPAQPGPASRADGDPAARGEHVHSEPAPPGTATAPPERPAAPAPSAGRVPAPAAARVLAPGAPGAVKPKLPERHSVRAQILSALRDALLSGELASGEVYSAPALAERFGVSPTPVREAMQQLASEGSVETVPNRGFRVAECSARDLAELAEIRVMLEVPAVLRLARTVPPERWDDLRPLADDTLTAAARGDRSAYAAADRVFHRALLELTGNRRLAEVAEDVQLRAQRCPARTAAPGAGAKAACAAELLGEASEHLALLDALQCRDLVTAERVLREHVAAAG